jgi:hypothetical protein
VGHRDGCDTHVTGTVHGKQGRRGSETNLGAHWDAGQGRAYVSRFWRKQACFFPRRLSQCSLPSLNKWFWGVNCNIQGNWEILSSLCTTLFEVKFRSCINRDIIVQLRFHVTRVFIMRKIFLIPYTNKVLYDGSVTRTMPAACVSHVSSRKRRACHKQTHAAVHRSASARWSLMCKIIDKTIGALSCAVSPKWPLSRYAAGPMCSRHTVAAVSWGVRWGLKKTIICIKIASFREEFRSTLLPRAMQACQSLHHDNL